MGDFNEILLSCEKDGEVPQPKCAWTNSRKLWMAMAFMILASKVMCLLGGITVILLNITFASVWIGLLRMEIGGGDSRVTES